MVGEDRKGVEADLFGEKRIEWIQFRSVRIRWDRKGLTGIRKAQIVTKRLKLQKKGSIYDQKDQFITKRIKLYQNGLNWIIRYLKGAIKEN